MLHHVRALRLRELAIVDSHFVEQPARRAVSARHAARYVLMKIDEDVKAVVTGHPAQFGKVIEVRGVVVAWSAMLDRLPRRQHPQAVESPRAQAREMFVRRRERKRPPDERDVAMVGKVGREISASIGIWDLAVAAEIDTAQNDAATG